MLKLMNFLKKGYVSCPNPSKSNFIKCSFLVREFREILLESRFVCDIEYQYSVSGLLWCAKIIKGFCYSFSGNYQQYCIGKHDIY